MNKIEPDMNTNQLEGHYKKHIDRTYIGSHDLMNTDGSFASTTVVIDGIFAREIYNPGRRSKEKCMVASLKDKSKDFIVNVTNQIAIESISGTPMAEKWVGVAIKLVVEKVQVGKEMKDGLRVKAP